MVFARFYKGFWHFAIIFGWPAGRPGRAGPRAGPEMARMFFCTRIWQIPGAQNYRNDFGVLPPRFFLSGQKRGSNIFWILCGGDFGRETQIQGPGPALAQDKHWV